MKRLAFVMALVFACGAAPAFAQDSGGPSAGRKKGQVTGLPLPRFVSLKADELNVRQGPGWDHAVSWVFRRAGLPVEIVAEYDVWRQVRDSEGSSGWVLGSLLSGRRTVLVAPWQQKGASVDLQDKANKGATVIARLAPGVLGDVGSCDGSWCRITAGSVAGYIAQELVWGAYRGEKVN